MQPSGPNAEQIEYWNQQAGPRWVAQRERLDGHIGELGRLALDHAAPAPGEHVVDVGCGCGETTLEIAARVGTSGRVLGIDVSAVMLAQARARAANLEQARFVLADAQTHAFEPESHLVYSRFGVMFFAQPVEAFRNLKRALRPGGRLCFVCWQGLERNPWMRVPLQAVAPHVELPAPPAPDAPGPFSFADPERVRSLLTAAGFRDIELHALERELVVGGERELEGAVSFVLEIGPTGAALREATAELKALAAASVRDALAPYATSEGVRMPCAAWIVSARPRSEGG